MDGNTDVDIKIAVGSPGMPEHRAKAAQYLVIQRKNDSYSVVNEDVWQDLM